MKKKPATASKWYEKHLIGLTVKNAYIKCEGHEVFTNGRKRTRVHVDEYVIKFTNGAELSLTCELPTWGFVGAKKVKK